MDADHAMKHARAFGQAATLMVALTCVAWVQRLCGQYSTASSLVDELAELADEKGAATGRQSERYCKVTS